MITPYENFLVARRKLWKLSICFTESDFLDYAEYFRNMILFAENSCLPARLIKRLVAVVLTYYSEN